VVELSGAEIVSIVKVSIEGLSEVDRQLSRLQLEVRGKALTTAIRKAANIGKRLATDAAPVGTEPGGDFPPLKQSVKTKVVERGERIVAIIGTESKARHAHLVEYGHRMVVGGSLKTGGRVVGFVQPRPWFRPARDQAIPEVEKTFLEELEKVVDKLAVT
jgi:HK97 gp10 family phage protein